jgi:hypothetical protein
MATVEVLETPQAVADAAAAALAFDVMAAVRAHGDAVWVAAGGEAALPRRIACSPRATPTPSRGTTCGS